MDSNAPRVHRQQALAAYVEPLAVGRRVAVFGDASLGLGARIAALGARSVHVWDPDTERVRREGERAPRGVVVSALSLRPLGDDGRDGLTSAFDLVVIPDLELFDDAEALLVRARHLVGEEGAVLVAAPNRDGADGPATFDYYELFDLVASQFDEVAMIAQLPFYGVALAELRDEDDEAPAVTVDMQLAGSDRTPEAFVALASQRGVRLDPYAIVELAPPPVPVAETDETQVAETMSAAFAVASAAEKEIADLRARLADTDLGMQAAEALEGTLRDRSARIAELESALAERSDQVVELAEEADRMREAIESDRLVGARVEELALRAERAERALAASEPDVARMAELHALEMARYEEALRDRAQAMRSLEVELLRRERMVRELVDALGETAQGDGVAPTPPQPAAEGSAAPDTLFEANALVHDKLDALALDLARREGEAQASTWTIAELERRLTQAETVSREERAREPDREERAREPDREERAREPDREERAREPDREERAREPDREERARKPNSDSDVQRRLASALDELDVLRRALAQEHEARMRAESGPDGPT
jgi:hypothetical protein